MQKTLPVIHLFKKFKHHRHTPHSWIIYRHTTLGLTTLLAGDYLLPPLQHRSLGKEIRNGILILGQTIIGAFVTSHLATHYRHTEHLNKVRHIHPSLFERRLILFVASFRGLLRNTALINCHLARKALKQLLCTMIGIVREHLCEYTTLHATLHRCVQSTYTSLVGLW